MNHSPIQKTKIRYILIGHFMSILVIFIIIGIIVSIEETFPFTPRLVSRFTSQLTSEPLLYIFGYENPYFIQIVPAKENTPSLISNVFKLATNIDPADPRSLLGEELPGYSLFDTKIIIAGNGTNYTTIPVESPPPAEVMTSQQDIAVNSTTAHKHKKITITNEKKATNGKKVIFIYETHSMESYLPALRGVTDPSSAWSSKINVGTVAKRIGQDIENQGLGAVVNTENVTKQLSKVGWNYDQSYEMSRRIVKRAMTDHPDYKLFFDIHRDASPPNMTTVTINNEAYARTMFIVGQASGNYQENLAMATELHRLLEIKYPGLSRGIIAKDKSKGNGVYNQDLSDHSLLIEVGGYGNNMNELYRTADALAHVITVYYWQLEKIK